MIREKINTLRLWLLGDPEPVSEERQANKLGTEAFYSDWHRNPYPVVHPLHKLWQTGYEDAKFHDDHA
jgi:hypothetical protein